MSGWNKAAWSDRRGSDGFAEVSGTEPAGASGWSTFEIAALVIAFAARWELGLIFLALKLWQQASRYPGNVFTFARHKWDALVDMARTLVARSSTFTTGARSTRLYEGEDFESWRKGELSRLAIELDRARRSESMITEYRETLLRARDRAEFDRARVVRP